MRHSKRAKTKDMGDSEFILQRVTKSPFDENHWSYIQKRFHMTPRELQVAQLACRGFNNNKIAKTLKAKTGTVKTHLRNIYRKIRVKSKIEMLLKFVNTATKFSGTASSWSRSLPWSVYHASIRSCVTRRAWLSCSKTWQACRSHSRA